MNMKSEVEDISPLDCLSKCELARNLIVIKKAMIALALATSRWLPGFDGKRRSLPVVYILV